MLRVTTTREKSSIVWIPAIIATGAAHLAIFFVAQYWAESPPEASYAPSRVEFRAMLPPPEPPPPEPKPTPEAPIDEVQEPKTPREVKVARKAPRKPNDSTEKSKASEQKQPKPAETVFGVTADSVAEGQGSVQVRVGNTLEKEMEKAYTAPKDVAKLPPAPPGTSSTSTQEPEERNKKPVGPVPVYELSKAPTFKKKVEPKYPEQARRKGIEGTVQLEILIDEKGRVRKIKVLKSPGHGLDRAAIAAVSQSKFHPGVVNGKAVPVKIKIPYRFVLDA